jgi:hypothetical protein
MDSVPAEPIDAPFAQGPETGSGCGGYAPFPLW